MTAKRGSGVQLPRYVTAAILFSGVLLVGFVLFELSRNTHAFSAILYTANTIAFLWVTWTIGAAVVKAYTDTLGKKLALALGILVGLVISIL